MGPQPLPGVQHVIAVGSGKGGVGKTTVAVNLAVTLAKQGLRVGLLDADIYGPNVPTMLGVTRQPSVLPGNMIEPLTAHGVKFMSVGLISPGDKPMVMRGPMLHGIIKQFLQQVAWGELDWLERRAAGRAQGARDVPPGQRRGPRHGREHEPDDSARRQRDRRLRGGRDRADGEAVQHYLPRLRRSRPAGAGGR